MARKNRYLLRGGIYHVTHRCHDRAFLLKFAKDRDTYRRLLYEKRKEHSISILGYCLTSNHIHLLVMSHSAQALSLFMQHVASQYAQAYNRRKRRSGAVWGDRYHASLVDTGPYLQRCLRYIDLNMVRARKVDHPSAWAWTGYQEIAGERQRYCLIDLPQLAHCLGVEKTALAAWYKGYVEEGLRKEVAKVRQPYWTETLAIGNESFAEGTAEQLKNDRARTVTYTQRGEDDTWLVQEAAGSYA